MMTMKPVLLAARLKRLPLLATACLVLLLLCLCSNYNNALFAAALEDAETTKDFSHCVGKLALITGATGRVGRLVAKQLLSEGFCVRVLTRNATKARDLYDPAHPDVEIVVGDLGDPAAVHQAFQAPVTHVVFAAGGEQADYDAVNHRGLQYCVHEAVQTGTGTSFVVISAAWVTKPYSMASLLFNSLYDQVPMARHLQGEDALRRAALADPTGKLQYVILRPGKLVKDKDYPSNAPTGVSYQQGDSFFFWGPAGIPGMDHSQLAEAVRTAMNIQGKYTVEITSGTTKTQDATVYKSFTQDQAVLWTDERVLQCHEQAMVTFKVHCQIFALVLVIFMLRLRLKWSWYSRLIMLIVLVTAFILYWYSTMAHKSVLDCIPKEKEAAAGNEF